MEADDMTSDTGPSVPARAADGPAALAKGARMHRQRYADNDFEPPAVGKHKLEHPMADLPILFRNFT